MDLLLFTVTQQLQCTMHKPGYPDLLWYWLKSGKYILVSIFFIQLESVNGTDDLVSRLCNNATGVTELIEFPPGVNTTAVNSVLCSFDFILLASEWSPELAFFEVSAPGSLSAPVGLCMHHWVQYAGLIFSPHFFIVMAITCSSGLVHAPLRAACRVLVIFQC